MYINNLITGSLTLGSGGSTPIGHSDTRVTYTTESGHADWSEVIEGELTNDSIPNLFDVETVDIGTSVTNIAGGALDGIIGLKTIIIPNSVTNIGWGAFHDSENIEGIVFQGRTFEQVQNIEDGNGEKFYPWGLFDESVILVT